MTNGALLRNVNNNQNEFSRRFVLLCLYPRCPYTNIIDYSTVLVIFYGQITKQTLVSSYLSTKLFIILEIHSSSVLDETWSLHPGLSLTGTHVTLSFMRISQSPEFIHYITTPISDENRSLTRGNIIMGAVTIVNIILISITA